MREFFRAAGLPFFLFAMILLNSGCATTMIEHSLRRSGLDYAEGAVAGCDPAALQLPLACFTLSIDASDCPELRPGLVWLLSLKNRLTQKVTMVQIKPRGPYQGVPGSTGTTHLIVLRLPAGEYVVQGVEINNINLFRGHNPFNSKEVRYDEDKAFVLKVENARVTYAGRLAMRFTGRLSFGLIVGIRYDVEWIDTLLDDEQWAETQFPMLRTLPSVNVPMQIVPTSTSQSTTPSGP
jgi:hypothetical protein